MAPTTIVSPVMEVFAVKLPEASVTAEAARPSPSGLNTTFAPSTGFPWKVTVPCAGTVFGIGTPLLPQPIRQESDNAAARGKNRIVLTLQASCAAETSAS